MAANSPQRSILATMFRLRKCDAILQLVLGKSANGVFQVEGSGDPLWISAGIEERGKFHIRMPATRSSNAYTCSLRDQHLTFNKIISNQDHPGKLGLTPPPPALKPTPYVDGSPITAQPAFPPTPTSQLLSTADPTCLRSPPILQPGVVCKDISLPWEP